MVCCRVLFVVCCLSFVGAVCCSLYIVCCLCARLVIRSVAVACWLLRCVSFAVCCVLLVA